MEKQNNYIGERLTRLPPGFRFQPTDEEIVFEYLKCKILSLPLPASIIPDLPLSSFDPWDLPGDPEEERYFFRKKEAKYRRGKRTNRTTSSGYWKVTGSEKHLSPSQNYQTLDLGLGLGMMKGLKKTFVFYRGKSPNARRTDWFMHEYTLLFTDNLHLQNCEGNRIIEDWVICSIFLKQSLEKEDDVAMVEYTNDNYQLTTNPNTFNENFANFTNTYYSSSSSSSNSVTEPSSNELQFEETSSP